MNIRAGCATMVEKDGALLLVQSASYRRMAVSVVTAFGTLSLL